MIEQIKESLKISLEKYFFDTHNVTVNIVVEEPKNPSMGDISIPLFTLLKTLHKPLPEIVLEVTTFIEKEFPDLTIKPTGAYINLILDKVKISKHILNEAVSEKEHYGFSNVGEKEIIVLDYSSPNIAKSFSIGHLRSTMIGNSLKLIYQKCGYKTVSINYLGDWGTQFGKMIVAYELWADKEALKKDPINEMTKLYVKFHEEAKNDSSLEEKARQAFKHVEDGEPYYLNLWRYIKDESLKESQQVYDMLDVTFDSYNGEAFYNDKMDPVIKELEEKKLLVDDQGARIVPLGEDMPPALIKRSDGGSLYITRDLAAVFYRDKTYHFTKALYVVGNEQKLHFTQLKAVLKRMGYDYDDKIVHVNFGLVLQNGKKMSTRSGNVVKLYDVLKQSTDMAYEAIEAKNPLLDNKDLIAKYVGVGAIVFNDLKNFRALDYDFDLEQMVRFEGQTGPYLQYTSVRIASILRDIEIDYNDVDYEVFKENHYFDLVKAIASFKTNILRAKEEDSPSYVAKYLLNLAQLFNRFYSLEKINTDISSKRNANLILAYSTRIVLNEGLRLLGIHYLDRM